jgi:hypothetical protein
MSPNAQTMKASKKLGQLLAGPNFQQNQMRSIASRQGQPMEDDEIWLSCCIICTSDELRMNRFVFVPMHLPLFLRTPVNCLVLTPFGAKKGHVCIQTLQWAR